jgi:outer membrane protein OmpU
MKHTLLATTALVAMTGAAAAEWSISATGRVGLLTTEGTAESTTAAAAGVATATDVGTILYLQDYYVDNQAGNNFAVAAGDFGDDDVADLVALVTAIEGRLAGAAAPTANVEAGNVDDGAARSAADQTQLTTDLATANALLTKARGTTESTTAAVADATTAVNRFRISFKGSGETDGGISYGISGRMEQSNSTTAGSQFVSGAFGKISMGDLDGADEVAAGGGVSGVGLSGLSDTNDIAYQSSAHNLGYEFSTSGMTFSYSQDTSVTTGSNSAMGLKYSGDMGGAAVTIGLGQSKVGTATQTTISAAVSSGGLTIKGYSSTNDNGPAGEAVTGVIQTATAAHVAEVLAADAAANNDTDQTALSLSYTMDSLTATAFTRTVSTTGADDQDFSGLGFAYDMGGVFLKAGVVDNNDQQLIDFGLSFSF